MRRIRDGRLLNMNGELDIKPTIGKEREKKGKWGGGGWECDKERKKRERKRPYQMNIIGAFVLKIVTVLPSSWSNLFPIISCSFSNYRKAWDKLQIHRKQCIQHTDKHHWCWWFIYIMHTMNCIKHQYHPYYLVNKRFPCIFDSLNRLKR